MPGRPEGPWPATKSLRVRIQREKRGGKKIQKRAKRQKAMKGVPGIPDEVFRRLVDRNDEYHLTPEGAEWLTKTIDALGLGKPATV